MSGRPSAPRRWRTSSYSGGTNCVEVAHELGAVFLRDSKDRGGPHLEFDPAAWTTFLDAVKDGEFDTL